MVELLNSIVLNDRMEAARVLVILTDAPNPGVLSLVRERARPALAEMARWKTLSYALPSFLVLGRAAGLPDSQIRQAWEKRRARDGNHASAAVMPAAVSEGASRAAQLRGRLK